MSSPANKECKSQACIELMFHLEYKPRLKRKIQALWRFENANGRIQGFSFSPYFLTTLLELIVGEATLKKVAIQLQKELNEN